MLVSSGAVGTPAPSLVPPGSLVPAPRTASHLPMPSQPVKQKALPQTPLCPPLPVLGQSCFGHSVADLETGLVFESIA